MGSGCRTLDVMLLLLALLTDSLLQLMAVSGRELPARIPRDQPGVSAAFAKRPTLLTFHGFVDDAQGQQPVILHVLIKAKRLPDRSFSVRAVSF